MFKRFGDGIFKEQIRVIPLCVFVLCEQAESAECACKRRGKRIFEHAADGWSLLDKLCMSKNILDCDSQNINNLSSLALLGKGSHMLWEEFVLLLLIHSKTAIWMNNALMRPGLIIFQLRFWPMDQSASKIETKIAFMSSTIQ